MPNPRLGRGASWTPARVRAITSRESGASLAQPVVGLGLDISKDAARQAARRWPALAFAVADLWAEWPVHDAAVDLVVSIFAPKNFPETARVLRPGGWLAIAYPGLEHLIELRNRFELLRQHEENAGRYADMARRFIGPTQSAYAMAGVETAQIWGCEDLAVLRLNVRRSAVAGEGPKR